MKLEVAAVRGHCWYTVHRFYSSLRNKMPKQQQSMPKRQAISLETKIRILDRLKRGDGPTAVGKAFRLSEATVRTIRKNETSIRQSIISGSKLSSKTASYSRNPILEKTEKHLVLWIADLLRKRIPIDGRVIKEEALRVYQQLRESEPSTDQRAAVKLAFNASEGWLTGFRRRHALHNVKIKADEQAEQCVPDKLANILTEAHPLDEDDFVDLTAAEDTNEADHDPGDGAVQPLTADAIREGLQFATSLEQHFLTHDPDMARALNFQRNLKMCLAGYQELLKKLRKQQQKTTAASRRLSGNKKPSRGPS